MIAQVGLIFRDHPASEGEVKRPSRSDDGVKESAVRLHVVKNAERPVNRDRENAVNWKKIRRERDPKIGAVGDDMAAMAADSKSANPASHRPNPKGMGQLVSENVKQDRTRQTDKSDQPKQRT